MSITNISQAPDFDQAVYAQLVETGKGMSVSAQTIDQTLLQALNQGMSFGEAAMYALTKLPQLPPPMGQGMPLHDVYGAVPSMCAMIMALITDLAAEQRRESAVQRAEQTEVMAKQMEDQADLMDEKAITQLVLGIVTAAISIVQGVTTMGMAAAGGKGAAADKAVLQAQIMAVGSAFQGVTGTLQSVSGAIGTMYDADIKRIDAKIERARALQEMLKTLEDSLNDVIRKALSSQDAIQQNVNQTRTKILT